MPMNIVIQEQRKLLGLTQEQVADYLGVSTPAVSKWEKGITSPDIGLLPPLARLLKIDLNTLFCFSEDLSEQEIGFFCNELAKQARNTRSFNSIRCCLGVWHLEQYISPSASFKYSSSASSLG